MDFINMTQKQADGSVEVERGREQGSGTKDDGSK